MPEEYRLTGVSRNSSNFRELDNLIKLANDLGARHAENGAIEEDVFASGQFRMKTSADLKQARDSTVDANPPFGGHGNPAQDFQQGALSRAVSSDDADHFAALDLNG